MNRRKAPRKVSMTDSTTNQEALRPGDIMPLREVAKLLCKHKSTIHDWIKANKFPPYCQPFVYHNNSRGYMFMRSDIERFIKEMRSGNQVTKKEE